MLPSTLWRRVCLVRTGDSQEGVATTCVLRLLVTVTANVPTSLILFTLKIAKTRFTETSVITRHVERHIQKDGILHNHPREDFKSYKTMVDQWDIL
jgi:hypothetical protein